MLNIFPQLSLLCDRGFTVSEHPQFHRGPCFVLFGFLVFVMTLFIYVFWSFLFLVLWLLYCRFARHSVTHVASDKHLSSTSSPVSVAVHVMYSRLFFNLTFTLSVTHCWQLSLSFNCGRKIISWLDELSVYHGLTLIDQINSRSTLCQL